MSTMSLKTSTGSNTLALHLVSSSMQLVESQGTITAFLRYKPGPEDWREREGEREGERERERERERDVRQLSWRCAHTCLSPEQLSTHKQILC